MTASIKALVPVVLFFIAAGRLAAQTSPDLRFGGHALGETAESFFSTATTESKAITVDYCKSLLDAPKTKEQVQAITDAANSAGPVVIKKRDFAVLDVPGCRQVMAALGGKQAQVGARLAHELGKGVALFSLGKLAAFNLVLDSPYADTIADMEKRFGTPGQKLTVARDGWPVLQETRWEKDGVLAAVWKDEYSQGSILVVGYLQPPYDTFLRGNPVP